MRKMVSGKGMLLLLISMAVLALAGLWQTPSALAHAGMVRAEPSPNSVLEQAPGRVTVWFSEPVESRFTEIQVLDREGRRVDNGDSARYQDDRTAISVTVPALPDGTYTVAWKNLSSVDGHPMSGSFAFSIGKPMPGVSAAPAESGAPHAEVAKPPLLESPAEPVLRWLSLLSILAIVGCLAMDLFISGPALAASGTSEGVHRMGKQLDSRTLKLVWLAGGIFLAASLAELVVRASVVNNIPVGQFLRETGWGHWWLWRMSALVALLVVLAMASLDRNRYRPAEWPMWQVSALLFAAGILFTMSSVSHGAGVAGIYTAAVSSDYLHLLAAGVWVGGIIYLALVAPPAMRAWRHRGEPGTSKAKATAGIFCPTSHLIAMSRFGALATLSVGILLITGTYSTWAQVGVVRAITTPYGIALLGKLGVIVPLLLLGAVNLFWVRPRLTRDGRALPILYKAVAGQAILIILVLGSVGMLVSLEPARQAESREGHSHEETLALNQTVESTRIGVRLEPNHVGPSRLTVSLADRQGRAIDNARVSLSLTHREIGPEGNLQYAASAGKGGYELDAGLSMAGPWLLNVNVQRPDAFDARTTFDFAVPSEVTGDGREAISPPSSRTGNLLWGGELFLIGLLILLVRWMMRRFSRSWTRSGS